MTKYQTRLQKRVVDYLHEKITKEWSCTCHNVCVLICIRVAELSGHMYEVQGWCDARYKLSLLKTYLRVNWHNSEFGWQIAKFIAIRYSMYMFWSLHWTVSDALELRLFTVAPGSRFILDYMVNASLDISEACFIFLSSCYNLFNNWLHAPLVGCHTWPRVTLRLYCGRVSHSLSWSGPSASFETSTFSFVF